MKDNIIDLSKRRENQSPESELQTEKVKNLKLRIEVTNAKLMISTSLLSVLILATVANTSMFMPASHLNLTAQGIEASRGIASVHTGTSNWEDRIAEKLASHSLKDEARIGRKPSSLQQLTFGTLEGKYAIRLQNGKVKEIEFSDSGQGDRPKHIADFSAFLKDNRDLLPTSFADVEPTGVVREGAFITETYRMVDSDKQDLGAVEFRLDGAGRMLSMQVVTPKVAVR